MIGERSSISGLSLPDIGKLIPSPRIEVAIDGIMDDVEFSANKPFIKRFF